MTATFTSGYAPAYHKDGKGVAHTAETILFCGGNNAAFGSEVGIAAIPFGGCVVMLDANECGHAACLSMDDAVLKGTYAEFGVACKEGVSIAHLRRLEELGVRRPQELRCCRRYAWSGAELCLGEQQLHSHTRHREKDRDAAYPPIREILT